MDRVQWGTKQSLDFAFLMMYVMDRGMYYVQLEHDIITKKGFVTTMKKIASEKTAEKKTMVGVGLEINQIMKTDS